MKVLQDYKSRKYLFRIVWFITLFMLILLILSSVVLHYSAETRMLQMQKEANRKVMNQINYNVTYMQELVKNTAMTLYNNNQVYFSLLANQNQEPFDVIMSINQMNKTMESSAFLHSIMAYNGHLDRIYAIGPLAAEMQDHYMAVELAHRVQSENKLPQMQLIPMNISGRPNMVDFFSLIVYETFFEKNDRESALILNVKPEWIFDNLRNVNDFSAPDQSSVFLIDEAGHTIMGGSEQLPPNDIERLTQTIADDRAGVADESFGFLSQAVGGHHDLITFMNMGVGNWKAISIQPYNAVLGGIYKLRMTSIVVIASFLLLAGFVSILVSRRLYQPVEQLLNRIRDQSGTESELRMPGHDELAFVSHAYGELSRKLHLATTEQDRHRSIVRNYHLRTFITSGSSLQDPDFRESVRKNELRVELDSACLLVIVKIDDYSEFLEKTTAAERLLISFAVTNISEEVLALGGFLCETADMRSEHMVIIVSGGKLRVQGYEGLLPLLERIQDVVQAYYKISLTLTLSDLIAPHVPLADHYDSALRNAAYKLVFGKKAIITPERVAPNLMQLDYTFPADLEKKLMESIKMNDLEGMEFAVNRVLQHLSNYHHDHIVHGILHLVDVIKRTIREMNQNRVIAVPVNLSTLSHKVLGKETIEEIGALLHKVCGELHEKLQDTEKDKNTALMDTIKMIVEENYGDANLSLQGIASMLRMTPAYVGRMFKMCELISVAEYMNEFRLERAREYLETKNFTIKEIMELVGYMNESTFFKLFKKKYGVTPKEYRLKRNIG
ncbi:MAG: hypothetical protein K0R67_1753 [Paenibacillus sp.]|nr:hypothetical protein [Paenibacillus sp.]